MRIAVMMARANPWAARFTRALAERDHELHVIDFRSPLARGAYVSPEQDFLAEDLRILEDCVERLHLLDTPLGSALRYVVGVPQLRRVIRGLEPDVVLSLAGGGHAAMAWAAGARPHVVYVVGSDVLLSRGAKMVILRRVLESAELVLANGRHLTDVTRRRAPRASVTHLYLGIDTTKFVPAPRPRAPVRIVCTRGFQPLYNNLSILKAVCRLRELGSSLFVTFTSPGDELPVAQAYADVSLDARRRQGVSFLGGVSEARLIDELQRSHIYISMSRSDGTAASTLEAMACGVYPVLSDIPANREWALPDAGNMHLVPLDDDDGLVGALREALEGREIRKRAADVNRTLVCDRASRENALDQIEARLTQVASARR